MAEGLLRSVFLTICGFCMIGVPSVLMHVQATHCCCNGECFFLSTTNFTFPLCFIVEGSLSSSKRKRKVDASKKVNDAADQHYQPHHTHKTG